MLWLFVIVAAATSFLQLLGYFLQEISRIVVAKITQCKINISVQVFTITFTQISVQFLL